MLNYNEFFQRLEELATEKGVKLTFSDKDFFYQLVEYSKKNGEFDYEKSMFCIQGSVRFFKEQFQMSSTQLVQKAITRLVKMGLIEKITGSSKKSVFYINLPYLLQDKLE